MSASRAGEDGGRAVARGRLALVLPPLLFVALYAHTLDYGLVWSDASEIGHGTLVRPLAELPGAFLEPMHGNLGAGLAELPQPYYRPLQVTLVSVVHHAFGARPSAYRGVSLLLGASALLLFGLLAWRLFGRSGPALAAGCIAAAHPAAIEPTVWIAGISEALASALLLACLLLSYSCVHARDGAARAVLGAGACAALVLAIGAKEKPVAAPLLVIALLASEWARARSAAGGAPAPPGGADRTAQLLRTGAVLVLIQGALAAAYLLAWRPFVLGRSFVGAGLVDGSVATHLLTTLALWPRALGWLVFPLHSTTSDTVRVVTSALDPMAWLGLALAAGSLGAWLLLLRRGRAVSAFGLAWVWIAYLPTSNLVPLLHARAERHMFFSVFGLALLVVALGAALARRAPGPARRWLAPALAAVAALLLALQTVERQPDWRSTRELMSRDVARDPAYREGRLHLSFALAEAGLLDEAARHARMLIDGTPAMRGTRGYLRRAEVYAHLCRIELRRRRPAAAVALVAALKSRRSPIAEDPALRICLADARAAQGRSREALDIYLEVAAQWPGEPAPGLALAIARAHEKLGEPVEARGWLGRLRPEELPPALRAEYLRLYRATRR